MRNEVFGWIGVVGGQKWPLSVKILVLEGTLFGGPVCLDFLFGNFMTNFAKKNLIGFYSRLTSSLTPCTPNQSIPLVDSRLPSAPLP